MILEWGLTVGHFGRENEQTMKRLTQIGISQ
jgi:hypothetical protein